MGAISGLYVLWEGYPLCCLMVEEKKQQELQQGEVAIVRGREAIGIAKEQQGEVAMGTGQTLQEGGWFDFYALMPLHAATVPGMKWYNHQMERYGWTFMH